MGLLGETAGGAASGAAVGGPPGAVIGAGIGLASSIISGNQQSKQNATNTAQTIAANKELAQYQYSKDLEMWNNNNAYNAPQAQMDRLKKAGLNPNLVYGNGAVANSSGSLPHYQAPTVDYSRNTSALAPVTAQIPAMISQFQDYQIKSAQIDNLKAQNNVINNQAQMGSVGLQYAGQQGSYRTSILRQQRDMNVDKQQQERERTFQMGVQSRNSEELGFSNLSAAQNRNRLQQQSLIQSLQNYQGGAIKNQLLKQQSDFYDLKQYTGMARDIMSILKNLVSHK